MCDCISVIPRQRLELILIPINEQRDIPEVVGEVFHLRAVDQFLSLQHAAEQEADNHQHDGDFDQGEAHLFLSHGILLSKDLASILEQKPCHPPRPDIYAATVE